MLSVDEKSQIQALDRTQPGLPLKPGKAGTMTHDYKRNGTTTCSPRSTCSRAPCPAAACSATGIRSFCAFSTRSSARCRSAKVIHAILDNYGSHKHPKVLQWLGRHRRWVFHFTPTAGSWLNAVETFFSALTRRRIRRGSFHSLVDLQAAINRYIAEHKRRSEAVHLDQTCRPHPRQGESSERVGALVHRSRQKNHPSLAAHATPPAFRGCQGIARGNLLNAFVH